MPLPAPAFGSDSAGAAAAAPFVESATLENTIVGNENDDDASARKRC
jgi:hypothetical protein